MEAGASAWSAGNDFVNFHQIALNERSAELPLLELESVYFSDRKNVVAFKMQYPAETRKGPEACGFQFTGQDERSIWGRLQLERKTMILFQLRLLDFKGQS